MVESRLKKSYLNARVNVLFYFITLFISFFSRKIFLDMLGADFVGLMGTLQNLLGFLNLAELGIGHLLVLYFINLYLMMTRTRYEILFLYWGIFIATSD